MRSKNRYKKPVDKEFSEKVIQVSRVSKKTKGGNQIGFSTLVVVGDKKGRVGVAMGKAPDVLSSIKKGVRKAKKNLIRVPLNYGTIPFAYESKFGAARVYLKPAPKGSGIIAGGAVRAVVEAAGVTDIVGKILGSNNQINNVYATYNALKEIRRLVKVKDIKLKTEVKKVEVKVDQKESKKPVKKTQKKAAISKTKKAPAKKEPSKAAKPKKVEKKGK